MDNFQKRAWAEIDLDNLNSNLNTVRSMLPSGTKVMAMVKADAYGHGAPVIAQALQHSGVDYFGVSGLDEAMQLRRNGIFAPIMITGYSQKDFLEVIVDNDITQTIYDRTDAEALSAAAVKLGKLAKVHIKIDTGMNRLGFPAQNDAEIENTVSEIRKISLLEGLIPEGIYTHFSDADNLDKEYTKKQFKCFEKIISALRKHGIHFRLHHCSNSAAIINHSSFALDMVRPGLLLYGMNPVSQPVFGLKPVMCLKTVVSQVKELPAGRSVSYGRKFVTDRNIRAAVIPVGYADGFLRTLADKTYVTVGGCKAPVIGNICMDQTIIDISSAKNVSEGDEVQIFGCDSSPSIDMIAANAGTVNYEISCLIGKRIPRFYYKDGRLTETLNYICK